jgi:hypothetical protein
MENVEIQETIEKETEDAISEGDVGKKRRRNPNIESKSTVRVELSDSLSKLVNEGIGLLAERGVDKAPSDFVESYLTHVDQASIREWVEKETPVEWRLKTALADPLKEMLIKRIFGLSSAEDAATLIQLEKVLLNEEMPKKERKKRVPRSEKKAEITLNESAASLA